MYLLDVKDGKLWWKEFKDGHWQFVSKETMEQMNKEWQNRRDKIAAKIFNAAFNSMKAES